MTYTFQQVILTLGTIPFYFLNLVIGGTRELFAANTCLEQRSWALEL